MVFEREVMPRMAGRPDLWPAEYATLGKVWIGLVGGDVQSVDLLTGSRAAAHLWPGARTSGLQNVQR